MEIPAALYDQVSGDADRFIVIAGHEGPGDERIVASDGYCVVRPRGPELRLAPQQPLATPHPLPAA